MLNKTKSINITVTNLWQLVFKILLQKCRFLQSYSKSTENSDGPKFADPSMAAVSPYIKKSMIHIYIHIYIYIMK